MASSFMVRIFPALLSPYQQHNHALVSDCRIFSFPKAPTNCVDLCPASYSHESPSFSCWVFPKDWPQQQHLLTAATHCQVCTVQESSQLFSSVLSYDGGLSRGVDETMTPGHELTKDERIGGWNHSLARGTSY